MILCDECGLPGALCNAIALYRRVVYLVQRGQIELALEVAADAQDQYDKWNEERKDESWENISWT